MGKELLDLLILSPPDFIYRKPDEPTPTYGEERHISYGALALATYLKHHGLKAMVAPMREFYQEHGSFIHFDHGTEASIHAFVQKTSGILEYFLQRLRPKTVGLTVNYAAHHQAAEIIVDLLRKLSPELPVLMGGNHATHTAEHWLTRANPVDFVILGEGERTCLSLLESGLKPGDLPGLGLRRSDGTVELRGRPRPLSIEEISIPADLSLAALPRWAPLSTQKQCITLSRGCNWRCAFCASPSMWGRQRYRKPEAVAAEIEQVLRAGVHDILFADDMLNPTSKRFGELLAVLRQYPTCRFSTMTRMDLLDRTDPERLREANIDHVYLGGESFSETVLAAMNKKIRWKAGGSVESLLTRLKSSGLKATLFQLIGHPGSNMQEDMYSMEICRDLASRGLVTNILPFFFAPLPGCAAAALQSEGKFRLLETRMNRWILWWRPVIELLGPSGEVIYSAEEMQRVFDAHMDIWRTYGLGSFGTEPV